MPGYRPAAHHQLIAETLDAVAAGTKKRVMIFMPPRHGKSELASRRFPAFFLGQNPERNIIAASYNSDLASDFGRDVRSIIDSQRYRALFDVSLSQDSKAANRFHTNKRGMYIAAGVGTAVTGRGAHCLPAGTLVDTDKGKIHIEYLIASPSSYKVLSLGKNGVSLEFSEIEAVSDRETDGLYRITSSSGRVVEATGDHPFFSGGKYVRADTLSSGDPVLLLVQEGVRETGVQLHEARGEEVQGFLLRKRLFRGASCGEEWRALRNVWRSSRKKRAEVLPILQAETKGPDCGPSCDFEALSDVQQHILGKVAWKVGRKARRLLLKGLLGARAFSAYVREGQSEVEAWSYAASGSAAFGKSVSAYAPSDFGERQQRLRCVRGSFNEAERPSYRQLADEQRGVELGYALQPVSSHMSRDYGGETAEDTVALVERICSKTRVYDIQVKENHNFFANGFLVHNCLLIDDPIKNREEADSETIRERAWRWYTSTAYTRLENDVSQEEILEDDWLWRDLLRDIDRGDAEPFEGAIVLVQTRWHDDDPAGRLLKQMEEDGGEQWEVLELPAIRQRDGEDVALWAEKYPLKRLYAIRQVIGNRDWSALYQQKPAPEEGLFFKRENMRYYLTAPKELRYYGASDYAVTADGGDYTVHVVAGVDPDDNIYIIDVWRKQTDSNVWIDTFCDLVKRYKPLNWAEEQGQINKSLGPFILRRMRERQAYCQREQFPSVSDKPTRARSFQARMAMGKVYFPTNAPWMADLEAEMFAFPAGVHDDQIDGLALIGRMMDSMVGGVLKRKDERKGDLWDRAFAKRDNSSDWKTA